MQPEEPIREGSRVEPLSKAGPGWNLIGHDATVRFLEQALAQAGFPGVEEETEVQLEFIS